jgi:hypothetical protein
MQTLYGLRVGLAIDVPVPEQLNRSDEDYFCIKTTLKEACKKNYCEGQKHLLL